MGRVKMRENEKKKIFFPRINGMIPEGLTLYFIRQSEGKKKNMTQK